MAVLVLALETSCRRGSVALVESGRVLADGWHDEANAHVERLLGLVDNLFQHTERRPTELTRVAVGRGPGAFTGLRVGLALAQGMASGLGIAAVGVSSLHAMAGGMPTKIAGRRWPILDARRGELFVACIDSDGSELVAPRAVPRQHFAETLERLNAGIEGAAPPGNWLLGQALTAVPGLLDEIMRSTSGYSPFHGDSTDWPGAAAVGLIATAAVSCAPAAPEYLRDADAVVPILPPSPLLQPQQLG